uniref:WW domain-containing protein n=1 Tax=Globisporangium ultimum (strain ATCC 200006 / CBS 805.95 / DAOM BR144) TaxID=431595 RepID=K3WXH4_GLOUD
MPPMHCAAYSGHTECLAVLLQQDSNHHHKDLQASAMTSNTQQQRRQELDKKHRTPLFYACATNKMDCLTLLLHYRSDWRDLPDKQLDTPVHVCCFFGWHECLVQLLDAGADPHVRNAKGFKPSHIAKTKECLELLLTYGDDLLQGDKLGRTPLFVASARDRALCVEFLCAWNHQTHSWMLEQEDQRGDRPIHAAACNGSVEALEILLKYGADPLIPNGKNLTPKDLATSNNHARCVEILMRAENELASATTWYAPANAIAAGSSDDGATDNNASSNGDNEKSGGSSSPSVKGWIECWDYDSGQPFYYHNLSGKCQWEVPSGFIPQLQQRHTATQAQARQSGDQQQQSTRDEVDDDDGSEYVWVKKKKQTVCVVTSKSTEWTAVQDPISKAIYYKNTRTGQSQWEEPDAVQQLQSASGAHAAQEASRIWDELEQSRNALAAAIAREKHRQLASHKQTLEDYKLHLRQRKEDMQKREDQARLQQLLPRSSFIRRKKQSMMMKVSPTRSGSYNSKGGALYGTSSVYASAFIDDEKLEQICAKEPALDIFLSTHLRLQGVQSLQVLTPEKRFCNCLYHYYIALVDPIAMDGLSKSQFRAFLRDAAIIPSASSGSHYVHNGSVTQPPLKLHIVDLIFAQAARADAIEASNVLPSPSGGHPVASSPLHHHRQASMLSSSAAAAGTPDNRLSLMGFITAMQIVRERVVTQFEAQSAGQQEIDDDEEWFLLTYLLPLTLKLGSKLLTQIRECKELDLQITASPTLQGFLAQHRHLIQQIHRHYSSQELKLKMLTFRGLSHFTLDFAVLLHANIPALHQLYEAVNWISGNAHTEIISC